MGSNDYDCVRKNFAESSGVESIEFASVKQVPDAVSTLWSFDFGGGAVSSYVAGRSVDLVVFDDVESKYAYWAKGGVDFNLYVTLQESDAEIVQDIP